MQSNNKSDKFADEDILFNENDNILCIRMIQLKNQFKVKILIPFFTRSFDKKDVVVIIYNKIIKRVNLKN